jgi:hypothetical protein
MRSKGGNYFGFSIWNLFSALLFHETGETNDTVGTLFAPKTPEIVAKARFLDHF